LNISVKKNENGINNSKSEIDKFSIRKFKNQNSVRESLKENEKNSEIEEVTESPINSK
jgi:hypothetical protein